MAAFHGELPVAECLGRLGGVGLDEEGVRMRQGHRKIVQLAFDAADHADCLAKIHLGVPRRMRQRHKHLARPPFLLPHVIRDDGDAAGEPVLVPEPLMDPLRRMPLLLQLACVVLQDLVDDRNERIELRPGRRLRSPIAWWHRVLQDLRNRLKVDPEHPRRFALAHSLDVARPAHPVVKLHNIYLPPSARSPRAQDAEFYSATVRSSDRFRCPFCLRDSHPDPTNAGDTVSLTSGDRVHSAHFLDLRRPKGRPASMRAIFL